MSQSGYKSRQAKFITGKKDIMSELRFSKYYDGNTWRNCTHNKDRRTITIDGKEYPIVAKVSFIDGRIYNVAVAYQGEYLPLKV